MFVSAAGMIQENYKRDLLNNDIAFEEGKHSEEKILSADSVIKSPVAQNLQAKLQPI